MAKKKGRDCTECIAYCNMLGGEGYRCGLGFEVVEDVEGGFGMWIAVVHPYENSCRCGLQLYILMRILVVQ